MLSIDFTSPGSAIATAHPTRITVGSTRIEADKFHVPRMESLLEIFGRPADHQAAQEHREKRHHHQAVQTTARAARSHFAQHHVRQQHRAAEAGEAVVGRVRRAVATRGGLVVTLAEMAAHGTVVHAVGAATEGTEGRFGVPGSALFGQATFAAQRPGVVTVGTLPTHRPTFVVLIVGVTLITVRLEYLPAFALGPLADALT